jgi:phosphomannomutase
VRAPLGQALGLTTDRGCRQTKSPIVPDLTPLASALSGAGRDQSIATKARLRGAGPTIYTWFHRASNTTGDGRTISRPRDSSPMAEPIISVSGLRGVIGESLSPELAARYACAFASLAPPGPLVIARDGRATGGMLAAALNAALNAVGRNTIDAGVASTPTAGVLVRALRAAGGVQISASHNPPQYNGLKLFSAEGRVLPANQGEQVIERYRKGAPAWVGHDQIGHTQPLADTCQRHLELVLATVDVERIRACRFRVLLDANHGSGSLLGARLLEALGCEVTLLGGSPDGRFAHPPEPTAANLASVLARVISSGAEVGFCQDPDADRLAIIDERGAYLGEEYTLALAVDHVLSLTPGPVVTNCSTSRMTEDLADKYGVAFARAKVGEANVVELMQSQGAVIGGEGNGGVIDPRVGYVRDSFAGMALVLDALAARGTTIGQWAATLPRYEIAKTSIGLAANKLAAGLAALERRFADARADKLDGVRWDWPGKWLLVRASNTEPIVRAIAEASTAAEANRLCEEARRVLEQV